VEEQAMTVRVSDYLFDEAFGMLRVCSIKSRLPVLATAAASP
jgi:hypothetical protein